MSKRALVIAFAGTAFLVFAPPYILGAFGSVPNGTETLILVALLWATTVAVSRVRSVRSKQHPTAG